MAVTLASKLGVKEGSRVCLLHPNRRTLATLRRECGKAELLVDRIERQSDVILYWVDPTDHIKEKVSELLSAIKPQGRIWLIIPKREICRKRNLDLNWNRIQAQVLTTDLVDNKIASINEEEYGTQFVIRKAHRHRYA